VALDRLERAAGWSLPGGFDAGPLVADGLLLVGDAAGLVDPFTGHGIHTACASGLMAARAVDEALRQGQLEAARGPLAGYQRLVREGLGRDLRTGRWLQRLHSRPILVELAMFLASRSRRFADRAMGLVGHALDRNWLRNPQLVMDLLEGDANWPPSHPTPWEGR
jgi:flavin-dependent dehydrogenase